jgi:hypothetical protein
MHRLLALCLIFTSLTVSAQTRFLQSADEMRKVTEGVVANVASQNTSGAWAELRPLSVIEQTDFDVFQAQMNSQQANLLRQFGEPTGYEFVRADPYGTRLMRYQYVVFHKKAAMRWNFVLYKAEKGWVISHFAFDANAIQYFQ